MDRTKIPLDRGYFPTQLPPAFTTHQLARVYKSVLAVQIGGKAKCPPCKSETYSVPRAGHQRRITSLANPISQCFLSSNIALYWGDLTKHFKKGALSISVPRFVAKAERAVSIPSMHDFYERKIIASVGSKYMLRTDISKFFPTIYSHSIPWALHGKVNSKKNRTAMTSNYYGNILDKAVRQGQDEQTFGVPIGPDTSHVIAEAVATSIDLAVEKTLQRWPRGFRYVDDYYLFFDSHHEAEHALSAISKALGEYELQLNFEKTQIVATDNIAEDYWTHQIRGFLFGDGGPSQRASLHHYFDFVGELARRNLDENIMKYALKRVSSIVVRKDNWDVFEAHLSRIVMIHPNTLQTVSHILGTYKHHGYALNTKRLERVLNTMIKDHAGLAHHGEVAWCLWICKIVGVKVGKDAVSTVCQMHSSVCALLLLDLERMNLTKIRVDRSYWQQFLNADGLKDNLWLLAYEGAVRKWATTTDAHVLADPHFGVLAAKNVRFHDETANSPLLFHVKETAKANLNLTDISEIFELDADVSEYFDFGDVEYGYSGAVSVATPMRSPGGQIARPVDSDFGADIPFGDLPF